MCTSTAPQCVRLSGMLRAPPRPGRSVGELGTIAAIGVVAPSALVNPSMLVRWDSRGACFLCRTAPARDRMANKTPGCFFYYLKCGKNTRYRARVHQLVT